MKILFIANRFPYPPFRGDKLKIFNLAKELSKSHELHLITFAENNNDFNLIQHIEPYFKKIKVISLPKYKSYFNVILGLFIKKPLQVCYFKSNSMRREVDELIKTEAYHCIHVQHLRMAQYAEKHSSNYRILDLPDAFSLYWQRRKKIKRNVFSKLLDSIESKRVYNYEKYILNQFNLNLVCSLEDQKHLIKEHQTDTVKLLPNGVDTAQFKPLNHDYSHCHTLLFTGNMDYDPNVDGVIYFSEEILPIIKQKYPTIKFIIAGQRPIQKVLDLKLKHPETIEVTGFVKDLSEMYNSASIVVAPLRFGAGTQNKVLEALAMGIPVVCSHIGFEGLGIKSGDGAFMKIHPQEFADQVIELLDSEQLRKETGEKGAQLIQSKFSWEHIAKLLESYFTK